MHNVSLQVSAGAYRGPGDVIRHVLAERGARGLLCGMTATLLRDVVGMAIMFAVFEACKQRLAKLQVK